MRLLSNKPNRNKQNEIWKGIVRKAEQDHDYSLSAIDMTVRSMPFYRNSWAIGAAAVLVLLLLGSLWKLWLHSSTSFMDEKELKATYVDASSSSKLILSTGDTVLLDGARPLDSNLSQLAHNASSLDFRKLDHTKLQGQLQTLQTGRGKQLHVTLSDGSEVWLNASSQLKFPAHFEAAERPVSVTGEAYFEVAHNKKSPFIVTMGQQQVKVLGTHFNTRGYHNERSKTVTLLEGAVALRDSRRKDAPTVLKPAEQYVSDGLVGTVHTVANPESVVAWRNGEFYFEDADALTIVRELERWYPVSIGLKQQDTTKKISGRIKRTDSMKEVVEMLRFFDIEITVTKNE
ncbi:FecR family protein [Sphingobacterium sp. BIGb0165]|uniref:FecR family protein n=1 Tax=Sphingobacterium sp. BIGb0165 TaxID=2940615 RepID=UPI0021697FFC|nr:FecR domain-containing protein [Sphingobacterium sp. BIGb0165]MCS4229166.1 ferric-dicitrate binding protein FerR (iron transport regulator) [Sphingobacterium sp. BIGb0165]